MYIAPGIFPDILSLYNHLSKNVWKGLVFHTPPRFEAMTLYGDRMAAVPMPTAPLFRGESVFHEQCLPSFYRRSWSPLELLERQVQLEDFKLMLQDNPEIREMEEGGLEVNYIGLAQHYGIETKILDLTNSFMVAAFFATTTYDSLQGVYRPVLHTVSYGVMYFSMMGGHSNFGDDPFIWPIGMMALRRPGEQRGFGIEMNDQQHDLNKYSGVHAYRFWHSPDATMRIWKECQGGSLLFPFDPMAEKVRSMRKYRIYSEEGLRMALGKMTNLNMFFDTARVALIKMGCAFVDRLPFAYTDKEIEYIQNLYRKMYSN